MKWLAVRCSYGLSHGSVNRQMKLKCQYFLFTVMKSITKSFKNIRFAMPCWEKIKKNKNNSLWSAQ